MKNQTEVNQIKVPEELFVMMFGGEYRRPLPGRGITILKKYRPATEIIAESANRASEEFPQALNRAMTEVTNELRKALKRYNRRMAYRARIKNSGS